MNSNMFFVDWDAKGTETFPSAVMVRVDELNSRPCQRLSL